MTKKCKSKTVTAREFLIGVRAKNHNFSSTLTGHDVDTCIIILGTKSIHFLCDDNIILSEL